MPNAVSSLFGLLPWMQREKEATDSANVTNRAAFLPLAEYDDGKVHPAVPGFLKGLGEKQPGVDAMVNQDAEATGREGAMLGLGMIGAGTLFGGAPKGAFAANTVRELDDVPWDLPDLKNTGAPDPWGAPDAAAPAAPAVKRSEGEIFDYGRQDGLPVGNPLQLPALDYYKSPRDPKPDSDAAKIMELGQSRKVQNSVNKAVERGLSGDNRDAVLNWYNTEPLRERFHDLYKGAGSPDEAYLKLMQAVGTTSPQNQVLPNAAEATRVYRRLLKGQDIPRDGSDFSGVAAKSRAVLSRKKFGQEEGYKPKDAQKTEFFGRSLAGDDSKVVVDSHAMRGLAMSTQDPRYLASAVRYASDNGGYENMIPRDMLANGDLTMKGALERPTYWLSSPTDATYRYAAKPYERAAEKLGLSPGQAQAAAWYGNADMTGVVTQPKTFNELFEQRLRSNATALDMDPEELLRRVINGDTYLLGAASPPVPLSGGEEQE